MNISKELYNKVYIKENECMGTKAVEIFFNEPSKTELIVIFDDGITVCDNLNIYELAHKCKEWALEQGYSCLSGKDRHLVKDERYVCSIASSKILIKDFFAPTELEAIFKACAWIMENIK